MDPITKFERESERDFWEKPSESQDREDKKLSKKQEGIIKMTQKEAVEILKEFLPQEAYYPNTKINNLKSIISFYMSIKIAYCCTNLNNFGHLIYHFSQVPCLDENYLKDKKITENFLKTPCICFEFTKYNPTVKFQQHLPYKGNH
jgi:hypothetical protein